MFNSVDVIMYGWYGGIEPRDNNGELAADPTPVQYIQYNEEVFTMIADSNTFNPLTFRIRFKPNTETTSPPQTEGPSVAPDGPPLLIVGVAVGGGLGVMIILLIIVLVCVFGRRRGKDKPKRKKRRR